MKLLDRQISESASFLTVFTPGQALWREAPGEWNVIEIVGRSPMRARLRALRIVRADPVMWTEVEFPGYAPAANFQARMLGDVVAEYAVTPVPNTDRCPACKGRFLHPDVAGLGVGQLGEIRVQLLELQARDLLVEVLRQHVDPDRVLLRLVKSSIWAMTWLANDELIT